MVISAADKWFFLTRPVGIIESKRHPLVHWTQKYPCFYEIWRVWLLIWNLFTNDLIKTEKSSEIRFWTAPINCEVGTVFFFPSRRLFIVLWWRLLALLVLIHGILLCWFDLWFRWRFVRWMIPNFRSNFEKDLLSCIVSLPFRSRKNLFY